MSILIRGCGRCGQELKDRSYAGHQQIPVWPCTGDNAKPEQQCHQHLRHIAAVDPIRYRAIRLSGLQIAAKEGVNLAQITRHGFAERGVLRRGLHCRIDDQAAAGVTQGRLDGLGEERQDRLPGRIVLLKPGQTGARADVGVALQSFGEQLPLAALGIVKARPGNPHLIGKIADRSRFQTVPAKAVDRGVEHFVFIE
jgi:hypothetical protein